MFDGSHILIWLLLFPAIAVLIYGGMQQGWYFAHGFKSGYNAKSKLCQRQVTSGLARACAGLIFYIPGQKSSGEIEGWLGGIAHSSPCAVLSIAIFCGIACGIAGSIVPKLRVAIIYAVFIVPTVYLEMRTSSLAVEWLAALTALSGLLVILTNTVRFARDLPKETASQDLHKQKESYFSALKSLKQDGFEEKPALLVGWFGIPGRIFTSDKPFAVAARPSRHGLKIHISYYSPGADDASLISNSIASTTMQFLVPWERLKLIKLYDKSECKSVELRLFSSGSTLVFENLSNRMFTKIDRMLANQPDGIMAVPYVGNF